jgi:transposase-like protein
MKKKPNKYSREVKERAERLVFESREPYESQWAAIESIASKIGCAGETLRHGFVRQGINLRR